MNAERRLVADFLYVVTFPEDGQEPFILTIHREALKPAYLLQKPAGTYQVVALFACDHNLLALVRFP